MAPRHTLEDVNNILLQNLYDGISAAGGNPEALLSFTEAVAKLNASSRKNDKLSNTASEEERIAQEERDAFASCAEGEIVNANQS